MDATSRGFKDNAHQAMGDAQLQAALKQLGRGFSLKRLQAAARLPEFEALRDQAREIKNHTLAHLDIYLETFEANVV
ncbi:MAG: (Fe-S)-binding protein, partial [Rhodospirillaceae bacterium]